MKRALILLAGLCAMSVTQAAPSGRFTPWTSFAGRTNQNTPFCSVESAGTGNLVAKNIAVKQLGGHQAINVTLYKDTWHIPQGTTVPVTLDFMDGQPLTVDGYGDDKVVDVEIPSPTSTLFLVALGKSKALQVNFPNGKEPGWTIGLRNAQSSVLKMVRCISRMEATQPY